MQLGLTNEFNELVARFIGALAILAGCEGESCLIFRSKQAIDCMQDS
jgi:hypothetical protein